MSVVDGRRVGTRYHGRRRARRHLVAKAVALVGAVLYGAAVASVGVAVLVVSAWIGATW